MYKRILVAVDGSATSLRGLHEAVRLAKVTGATVRVVHVVNELALVSDWSASVSYSSVIESLRQAAAKVLEEAAALARQADVLCEPKLIEGLGGRAADEIINEANEWSANLIVLGTHGRRGLKRLAMGSDAELVLRLSPVPVLMVRDQPETTR